MADDVGGLCASPPGAAAEGQGPVRVELGPVLAWMLLFLGGDSYVFRFGREVLNGLLHMPLDGLQQALPVACLQ